MTNKNTPFQPYLFLVFNLTLFLVVFQPNVALANNIPISMQQVDSFLRQYRASLLTHYRCEHSANREVCKVVCSAEGGILVDSANVSQAYFAERVSNVNGRVANYILVVDANDRSEDKNVWAILENNASCMFEGLRPGN